MTAEHWWIPSTSPFRHAENKAIIFCIMLYVGLRIEWNQWEPCKTQSFHRMFFFFLLLLKRKKKKKTLVERAVAQSVRADEGQWQVQLHTGTLYICIHKNPSIFAEWRGWVKIWAAKISEANLPLIVKQRTTKTHTQKTAEARNSPVFGGLEFDWWQHSHHCRIGPPHGAIT